MYAASALPTTSGSGRVRRDLGDFGGTATAIQRRLEFDPHRTPEKVDVLYA